MGNRPAPAPALPRRAGIRWLLLGGALFLQGCTAIGYGIDLAVDDWKRSPPRSLYDLDAGEEVVLEVTSESGPHFAAHIATSDEDPGYGSSHRPGFQPGAMSGRPASPSKEKPPVAFKEVGGVLDGLERDPGEYRRRWEDWARSLQLTGRVPSIGDSVMLRTSSGSTRWGIFLGIDAVPVPDGIERVVRVQNGSAEGSESFSNVDRIVAAQGGSENLFRPLMARHPSGRVPTMPLVSLSSGSDLLRVPLDDVRAVRTRRGNEHLGLFIGLGIDAYVFIALATSDASWHVSGE